jgi:hypothetical protein
MVKILKVKLIINYDFRKCDRLINLFSKLLMVNFKKDIIIEN